MKNFDASKIGNEETRRKALSAIAGDVAVSVTPLRNTPTFCKPSPRKATGAAGKPNRTEEKFNREMLGGRGMYEAITFKLAGGSRYTPDWVVISHEPTGIVYHVFEVKGSFRFGSEGRARTAFLEARERFKGIVFQWYVDTKDGWTIKHERN